MRLERMIPFWLFWAAVISLAAWTYFAPSGYLAFTYQWLTHIRYEEIWVSDQRAVSDKIVLPELKQWAEQIEFGPPPPQEFFLHRSGEPVPAADWVALEEKYVARGIEVSDQIAYIDDGDPKLSAPLIDYLGRTPFSLKRLFYDIQARFQECPKPLCGRRPGVAWVYVYAATGARFFWPGGDRRARFEEGKSPSLAYTEQTLSWLDEVLRHESSFEALEGDSLGFGDTMITTYRVSIGGVPAIIAADTYWEEAPIRSIRLGAIVYSGWGVGSFIAVLTELFLLVFVWIGTRREGNGVCVTVDIVGWSQIDDIQERFKRQQVLDTAVKRSFFACTSQRLVRLSTGDGYHILFLDHWGANIYRQVLPFVCEMLARWEAKVGPAEGTKGKSLRVSIGSHGSAKIRRRDGDWTVIGDRIVSAVRIDEVSKTTKAAEHGQRTIAVEQSFKNEVRLAATAEYDRLVLTESGPCVARDKAGKEHSFSLLTLAPTRPQGAERSRSVLRRIFRPMAQRDLPAA